LIGCNVVRRTTGGEPQPQRYFETPSKEAI
jgi:hypothetical protein